MNQRVVDLSREQSGAWRVIWRAPQDINGNGIHAMWLCRCACGTVRTIRSDVLLRRRSPSCGCMKRDQAIEYEHKVKRDEREEWSYDPRTDERAASDAAQLHHGEA